MELKREIIVIEFTLKKIFEKEEISDLDVIISNKLLNKWKKLTGHIENDEYPLLDFIIDDEPDWKNYCT
jgi:hypothetical protein